MKVNILNKDGCKTVDLNRRKAIRERCMNCSGWNDAEVNRCKIKKCALWPYRMGTGEQDTTAREKAIRTYCLWCMCGQRKEVELCPSKNCPLFAFRLSVLDRSVEIKSQGCRGHIEACSEVIC